LALTRVEFRPSVRGIVVKIVVDAYAWIELFRGSEDGRKAAEMMSQAMEVYTPGTVLAEIARKYIREGVAEEETTDRLRRIEEASQVAEIDIETAVLSAKGDIELRKRAISRGLQTPSLLDGIVLGTARRLGCRVLTGDEHFEELPETIMLGSES
jgi:predicted nucleic acid-binding protein